MGWKIVQSIQNDDRTIGIKKGINTRIMHDYARFELQTAAAAARVVFPSCFTRFARTERVRKRTRSVPKEDTSPKYHIGIFIGIFIGMMMTRQHVSQIGEG